MKRKPKKRAASNTLVLRLPAAMLRIFEEVADIADLSVEQVVHVILAMRVWRGTIKKRRK